MEQIIYVIISIFLVVIFISLLLKYAFPAAIRLFTGGRQRLILNIQEPLFSEVKAGRKTVEARVGPADIYKNNIGKPVKVAVPGGEKLKAIIKDVRHYATLDEFIKKEGWKKVAPNAKSEKEAIDIHLAIKNKAGETIYDDKRIKERGGVTAIELSVQ